MILRGGGWNFSWRQLVSGPIIAVFLGVMLNWTHLASWIPGSLLKCFDFLGGCAVPLSLILTGAIACDFRSELNLTTETMTTLWGIFLRIGLIPVLFLLVAWCLPNNPDLKKVLVVQSAMPAAMLPIVLTKLYGGNVKLALRLVVATSLVSFITIPLVIHWGLRLLNLP
jgi:predicted permease